MHAYTEGFMHNPATDIDPMAFDVFQQGDRKVNQTTVYVRFMTVDEIQAIPKGHRVECLLNNGRLGSVKVTSIKTWKRDPQRVEIGVKYGMYNCATLSLIDASHRFVVRV